MTLPPPRPPFRRRYGGALAICLLGLGLLALAVCMLVFREQADAVLEVLVRRRRSYGPGWFMFYLSLVTLLGLFLSGLAGWALLTVPKSESRLDRHLSKQMDDLADRNTRGPD